MPLKELINQLKAVKTDEDITDELFANLMDATLKSGAILLMQGDSSMNYKQALVNCGEMFNFNANMVAKGK